jgi:hypothetical protein
MSLTGGPSSTRYCRQWTAAAQVGIADSWNTIGRIRSARFGADERRSQGRRTVLAHISSRAYCRSNVSFAVLVPAHVKLPHKFFDGLPQVLKDAPPLPGEEARCAQILAVAAQKHPALKGCCIPVATQACQDRWPASACRRRPPAARLARADLNEMSASNRPSSMHANQAFRKGAEKIGQLRSGPKTDWQDKVST